MRSTSGLGDHTASAYTWRGFESCRMASLTTTGYSLDADYKSRPRTLSLLSELGQSIQGDEDEGLLFLGNRSYFGAVFLTTSRTLGLQMLINREGFVPDPRSTR